MTIKSNVVKPVAAAIGAVFVSSLAVTSTVSAGENPFAAADLDAGYLLASNHEKGEEGKCGENKGEEGSCGEGEAHDEKGEEGKCGEGEAHDEKGEEGSCGEGKAGEEKGEEGNRGSA